MDIPKRIYLQIFDDDGHEHDEVTWCDDSINDSDVEYVLVDPQRLTTVGATDDTTKSCPDSWHEYYKLFLSYQFCPYCGERIFS